MKEVFFNEENIKDIELDEKVTRVKALIINNKNEIYLSCCENIYQFPGGHLEANETLEEALKREIKEELGIKLENISSPYLHIAHLKRNYRDTGKNRQNDIYYYFIKTNENPNLTQTNFDEYEKKGNYKTIKIKIEDFINVLNDNKLNKNEYAGLTKEMVRAYQEVLKLLQQ